jgi:hypothetical protein
LGVASPAPVFWRETFTLWLTVTETAGIRHADLGQMKIGCEFFAPTGKQENINLSLKVDKYRVFYLYFWKLKHT